MAPRRRRPEPPTPAEEGLALGEQAARLARGLLDLVGPGTGSRGQRSRQLSPSLRRAANRGAGPRTRQAPQRLLDAAEAGLLTRNNTKPGTAGRKAVYAVGEYRKRTAGRPEGITARTAAGHESEAARRATRMSVIVREGRFVEFGDLSRSDRRRIARWNALASNLATGDLSPADFRRRVRAWAPIGDEVFEWDPDLVVGVLAGRREAGESTFIYRGRRR